MKKLILPLLLALPSLVNAQTIPNNRHLFYVGEQAVSPFFFSGVSAATRVGYATTQDVECFSDVSAAFFRGVGAGFAPTSCKVTGQVYVVQDNDQTTQNPYKVILRKPVAPDGLPDTTAAGLLAISGSINTPLGTGTGGVAWMITLTWATPVPTIPCETGYYIGVELLPETSTTDYTTTHTGSAFSNAASPFTGDNPRVPTPKYHAVAVLQGTTPTATRTTTARTLTIVALTDMPTLNVGNIDGSQGNYKSYGIGGLYPAVKSGTRDDGISVRVQDGSSAGGIAAIFLSTGFFPGGLAVPTIGGALWLNPGVLIQLGSGAIPSAAPNSVEVVIAVPGTLPSLTGVKVAFQALTADPTFTVGRLSNAQLVSF